MVQKIKEEKPTTDEESDSGSDVPSTPLAASTQRSPLKSERRDDDESDVSGSSSGEDSEDYQPATQERIVSPEPDTGVSGGGASMDKYLSKFPYVRPSKPKYSVDVDLTDPDDEVWIVQCPASMDAKKVLQSAKFEDCRFGQAGKIKTSQKRQQQIEGFVVENTNRKPVVILSGKEFKSFVPKGTIQIREMLNSASVKQESLQIPEDEDDAVPYPENLRDRHPLLGLNYKTSLKLPKKVKKALSLAQQRAEACYLQPQEQTKQEKQTSPSKKNKRKRKESDEDEMLLPVAEIKQELSDVVPSPARKKVKKEKKEKVAVAVEDDLSWLHNI